MASQSLNTTQGIFMQSNIFNKAIRITTLAAVFSLAALHAFAAAPMAKTFAPGYYRFMLGNFEVTALSDGTVNLPVEKLLQEPAEKTVAALDKAFLKTPVQMSDNAYLVNTGKRLVLIDTGAGTLFGPTLGKLMNNLKASGYKPEEVDDIFLTHMHPDHVGGLSANGVLQFPNAVVHAERLESDYWLSQKNLDSAPDASKDFFKGAMASVNPYVQAGKFSPFEGNVELVPGVRSYTDFGHTPGHTSYVVESEGQKLLLIGDLIHVTAVQLDHPKVTIAFDTDPKAAAASRIKVFNQAARERTLVGAAHIQFPGIGHLRATGKTYQWVPVNFTQMPAGQQKPQ
jgi:glyoxylase-like metal-dependent hydrolase (beta-lactamase superfamily II)